jgi:uncharacterized protein YciI
MLYAVMSEDVAYSSDLRARARAKHMARLKALIEEGRLVLAGPHPTIDSPDPGPAGFSGSLVVAEFDSLEEAQRWADEDPYLEVGAYHSVTVKPFKLVLP